MAIGATIAIGTARDTLECKLLPEFFNTLYELFDKLLSALRVAGLAFLRKLFPHVT